MDSLSLFKECVEGLVSEVRGQGTLDGERLLKSICFFHHKDFVELSLLQFAHHLVQIMIQLAHFPVEDVPQVETILENSHLIANKTTYKE